MDGDSELIVPGDMGELEEGFAHQLWSSVEELMAIIGPYCSSQRLNS